MYLHIDIDSFFASAHRSVDKSLIGIPIAVGARSNLEIFAKERVNIEHQDSDNSGAFVTHVLSSQNVKTFDEAFVDVIEGRRRVRGIITTASYEARAYGVKTAMPIAQALQLCPHLKVIPSMYRLYHHLSQEIREYLQSVIPSIEQFSIDEFFADLSGWVADDACVNFAYTIQKEILQRFNIPVSIGISTGKWVAKLATEEAKPYGVYKVENIDSFLHNKKIEEFPGVGKAYEKKLKAHGIYTLGEVRANRVLFESWKKPGMQLYNRILGLNNEKMEVHHEKKSIGISRTFDAIDAKELQRRIVILARHIVYMVSKMGVNPTHYYLTIHYTYNQKVKINRRLKRIFSEALFKKEMLSMYRAIALKNAKAIKLSMSVSHFAHQSHEIYSMLELEEDMKKAKLSASINLLRDRFGLDIIKNANEI